MVSAAFFCCGLPFSSPSRHPNRSNASRLQGPRSRLGKAAVLLGLEVGLAAGALRELVRSDVERVGGARVDGVVELLAERALRNGERRELEAGRSCA